MAPPEKGEYEQCQFVHCDFSNADLSGILFIDCSFSHCNLSLVALARTCFRDVVFTDCKLWGLHFEHADPFGLSVSFVRCSVNYSIDPTTNKIKKARFSLDGVAGLLDKYDIEIVKIYIR